MDAESSEKALLNLEKFVCFLYGGQRVESVDQLRYKMFLQKIEKEGKVSRRSHSLTSLQI